MTSKTTLPSNGLPAIKRLISDVNKDGKAVFLESINEDLKFEDLVLIPFGSDVSARSVVAYATNSFPTTLRDQTDIKVYEEYTQNPPGVSIPNGTVLRYLDFPPGARSPMHKTKSLDYGIVLEGTIVASLDSGEERVMHRGDVLVQRGTEHDWRNGSDTEWARMVYVLLDSHPN
ncbi:hypothetical protein BJY00DRAFT_185431 [Aspergillus carlsbadensis]|nr:hypothetical protein BJY00DRAFT_185431 [Aspergillus carlsbadensis]